MLETFTVETFARHVGETFRIGDDALDSRLSEATALGSGHNGAHQRAPFSLVFHGPPDVVLAQRIHPVQHDALGRFELFLVPIGPDERGMRYQAVFT